MSCYHCGAKFNFFHKEIGCSKCGLSFCGKCLKQKCKIPGKGSSEVPVCKTCFHNVTEDKCVDTFASQPPDAYLKRVATQENSTRPPITIYKQDSKLSSLRDGLSVVDQQIIDRLEKLRYGKNKLNAPTESELSKRLKTLKGENEYVEGPKAAVVTIDTRSEQEKVDSLLEQFMQERDIELAHNPEEGIVARLANLREKGVRPNEGPYVSNLHDSSGSDEDINRITKKIMDEVSLEEKTNSLLPEQNCTLGQDELHDSSELPWCVLCNNDAVYRCLDCNDLYCTPCNIEVHQTLGETDHKVIQYKHK